jgi:hypothetical protein
MGKSRSDRRASSGELANLYAKGTLVGCRVVRQVPITLALEKVALGVWRRVFYEDGAEAGFQPYAQPPTERPRTPMPGVSLDGSPPTITLTEVQMNAGLFGRSRTMGMPEWKRLKRHAKYDEKKILAPEDEIERAIEKVKLWPYPASRVDDGSGDPVYGDRAVRVYPHTK